MSENQALLPCPFCGCLPIPYDGDTKMVHSPSCYLINEHSWLIGGSRKLKEWNTRTTPPLPTKENDLLSCPFCKEHDFDLVGLKIHLTAGHCDMFNDLSVALPITMSPHTSPPLPKPSEMKSEKYWADKINEVLPALMEPVKCSTIENVVKQIQDDALTSVRPSKPSITKAEVVNISEIYFRAWLGDQETCTRAMLAMLSAAGVEVKE